MYKKGHKHSEETKRKIGLGNKNKIVSEETGLKLSLGRRGKDNPNYGNHLSLENRKKLSESRKESGNPNWKGDDIKCINAIHAWIKRRKLLPKKCEVCGEERKLDLANIKNHNYTRKLQDYMWLCRSCHIIFDRVRSVKLCH